MTKVLIEELSKYWPISVCQGVSLLLIDKGGPNPLWPEPFLGQVVLSCIRILAKREHMS